MEALEDAFLMFMNGFKKCYAFDSAAVDYYRSENNQVNIAEVLN